MIKLIIDERKLDLHTVLKPHRTRKITKMKKDDARVPAELFSAECIAPDLTDFPYPLPSKKSDYTCYVNGDNGVVWYGGKSGVTRYDPTADRQRDIIMYFAAHRHLTGDKVEKMLADGNDLWVLTDGGVTYIEMPLVSAFEKAEILRDETKKYVQRRGMVSQRGIRNAGDIESVYPYADCDNDGLFTAGFAIGEMFRYAVLREKLGKDDPKTVDARRSATEASEACLLLMYIHGRPEGFIARSYHVGDEPVPDDGHFYKRCGDKAVCVETTESKKTGRAVELFPATYPVPDRLARLYRDLGYTEDDITYKADTSSDEVTAHFVQMRCAHDILCPDDPELDEIIKDACRRTSKHIIDGGFEFLESSGKPTTWAKWSKNYFENDPLGYVDACLNACEALMYLKATMYITGENGEWKAAYDKLISDGYADLGTKHFDRMSQGAVRENKACEEDLMYGDNMLALLTFWQLCTLENDTELLEKYRDGFRSWRTLLLREHNPGYDFMYKLGVPDAEIDIQRDADWFNSFELSRMKGAVHVSDRHDVPVKLTRSGDDGEAEISCLLSPAEIEISKYDRNPYSATKFGDNRGDCVESCYVYTYGYWMGRYYGFIDEEE